MKRTALVTGAATGIGSEIVYVFAKAGYKVYASARTKEKLADTLAKCEGLDVEPLCFDLLKPDTIREAIDGLEKLDVLVNCAGISVPRVPLREITDEDWDVTLDTNIKGNYVVTVSALKKMERGASIINISSGAGKTGGDFVALPYSTSKGAINTLTVCYARELAPEGIRVNAVSPGFVDTHMLIRNEKLTTEYYDSIIPIGRLGQPDDIAKTVLFLASDDASWITGQIIEVNGGDIMG